MNELTHADIEDLVMKQGNPESLILADDDWKSVYSVYRQTYRDEDGCYVLVINTKIRPKTAPEAQIVDLSAKPLWAQPATLQTSALETQG